MKYTEEKLPNFLKKYFAQLEAIFGTQWEWNTLASSTAPSTDSIT